MGVRGVRKGTIQIQDTTTIEAEAPKEVRERKHHDFCLGVANILCKYSPRGKIPQLGICAVELSSSTTGSREAPDIIGFVHNLKVNSYLFEIKLSREDFLADKKKVCRKAGYKGMGCWRFYVTPPNLIYPDELPNRWGLIYYDVKKLDFVVMPTIFHEDERDVWAEQNTLCNLVRRGIVYGKVFDNDDFKEGSRVPRGKKK